VKQELHAIFRKFTKRRFGRLLPGAIKGVPEIVCEASASIIEFVNIFHVYIVEY
jgi:hypothetical protein